MTPEPEPDGAESGPPQPHDAFFKEVFSDPDYAALFFQRHLSPSLIFRLDWASLKPVAKSFVKRSLRQMYADLLFTAPLDGNRSALLYLLFEHQSTVDPIMPLRLLGYMHCIYEDWHKNHGLPLAPVLSFVLHQGPEGWTVSTSFEDLFQLPAEHSEELLDFLPKFRHALLDLSQADPASEESDTRLQVILHLMKLARINQIHEYFRWLVHGLRERISDGLMARAIFYALQTEGGLDVEDIYRILSPNPTLERQAMSVAEKLIARGRQEGRQEGQVRGLWIGRIRTLQEFLGMDEDAHGDLDVLSEADLERLHDELRVEYKRRFKKG